MNKLMLYGMVAAACVISGPAMAHDYYDDHGHMMDGAHGHGGRIMKLGRHWMVGTVESVDHKAGWVKVKTEEGVLTVHFPPDSVKDLKDGETITVHLSYSKGEMKPGPMMEQKKTEKPEKNGGTKK